MTGPSTKGRDGRRRFNNSSGPKQRSALSPSGVRIAGSGVPSNGGQERRRLPGREHDAAGQGRASELPCSSPSARGGRVPWSSPSGRFRLGRVARAGGLVALAAFSSPQTVATYQFFPARGAPDESPLTVAAEAAQRWSAAAWPPGDTLIWHIAGNDPDWNTEWYGSAEGVAPFFEEALAAWSDIPTADISWRLAGVDNFDEEAERRHGRNYIAVDAGADTAGYADIWAERSASGTWEIRSCSLWLGSGFAEPAPDWWLEMDERSRFLQYNYLLVHELGHCLGLAHTQLLPGTNSYYDGPASQWRNWKAWSTNVRPLWHSYQPAMSYGIVQEAAPLTADDRIGASLLRPGAGWVATTGSISGRLHHDGEPAVFAHVWAFPNAREPRRDGIGGFSDREGRFLIEGLPPGDYTLWASPLADHETHPGVFVGTDPLQWDLKESVRPHPVRVVAGQMTEGVEIGLTRGRRCRPPMPCDPPR